MLVIKFLKHGLLIGCLIFTPNLVAQVLITHAQNTTIELSKNKLRAIFAMRTAHWADGSPIHVFVLEDDNTLHATFCKDILGMYPYQLRRIWDRQVFSGTGVAPITVKTEQEMVERVSQTHGAIGYIHSEILTSSVKTIGKVL